MRRLALAASPEVKGTIYTIGHSTRSIDEFIALLEENAIDLLIDVRRFPGSKRYPHFGKEQLPQHLHRAGIDYEHAEVFGGRRRPAETSANDFWRNDQFRGYADHMSSQEFQRALDQVVARAGERVQAVMCAEAVPWRCHRQLLADALIARGLQVLDIINAGEARQRTLHPSAQVLADGRVIYPAAGAQMDLL